MRQLTLFLLIMAFAVSTFAQGNEQENYLDLKWKKVATRMPDEWYGSEEARTVAENVLFCQKDIGGWEKNKPYHHHFSEEEKEEIAESKDEIGATFDNGATIMELQFLTKVYSNFKDERYMEAFKRGLQYIFDAQYENGGWPQFYPVKKNKNVHYSAHITFNDNAMVNIMRFLEDVYENKDEYSALDLPEETRQQAKRSFDAGVQCILKTQIQVDGQPTVWCAQHDENTLAPADARSFELASFSGAESVDITLLLMNIDYPTAEVVAAVKGAVQWFETHKIEGIKLKKVVDDQGRENRIVVEDKNAEPLWARFYDLEMEKPFFCDRDGVKKSTMAEIGYERRNGYSWYTDNPEKVLKKYPKWKEKWGV